jgi:protoporphyrinogen oxidase
VNNITTGFSARHVRRSENGWLVSDGQREMLFERLVATLPINEMAYMFEGVPQEIKDCVNSLRYNSLFTVTIGLASERLPNYTAVYVPDPELLFHRLSFPAQFSPSNVPAGRSLVQAEITSNPGDGVWELDDSEVLRRVISGLEGSWP